MSKGNLSTPYLNCNSPVNLTNTKYLLSPLSKPIKLKLHPISPKEDSPNPEVPNLLSNSSSIINIRPKFIALQSKMRTKNFNNMSLDSATKMSSVTPLPPVQPVSIPPYKRYYDNKPSLHKETYKPYYSHPRKSTISPPAVEKPKLTPSFPKPLAASLVQSPSFASPTHEKSVPFCFFLTLAASKN